MASNPTFRFESEEDEPKLPSRKPAASHLSTGDLQRRARELQQELGKPEDILQAHLDRMSMEKSETKESSAVERLQRDGVYPCKEFVPPADLPKPSERQLLLVKKLAATYFQIQEHEISLVQPISEVLEKGEKVFFAGAFSRPIQWVNTWELEMVREGYELFYPQHPENLYRVQLRNGHQYWVSHREKNPLSPMGYSVFTRRTDESFDPNRFHPSVFPLTSQPIVQELVGRNTEFSEFARKISEAVYQQFGKDVTLSILQVGVPGQSGPLFQVRFTREPEKPSVYLSAQQLAVPEVTPEQFQALMKVQQAAEKFETPESVSEGVRAKISALLGRLWKK